MLQLIAEALNNAPEKTLVMADIFMAISDEYPYCQALETVGWQNNLTASIWPIGTSTISCIKTTI